MELYKALVYLCNSFFQLAEMNGKIIISKPLYVALAQRKEERRARLQVGGKPLNIHAVLKFCFFYLQHFTLSALKVFFCVFN